MVVHDCGGKMSPEIGVLANQCMNTLTGGDWRRALKGTADR
jgi:hypothetical protein